MAEMGGTKILITITICIMLISIGFSGCIGDSGKDRNDENDQFKDKACKYYYEIKINCTNTSYDLNVPLPVYCDEKRIIRTSKIIEDLKVVIGKSLFYIENTPYGPSLKIKGMNNTIINVSGNNLNKFLINNSYKRIFFSMAKDLNNNGYFDDDLGSNMKFWLWCDQNASIEIFIFLYEHIRNPNDHIIGTLEIKGIINKGWNLLNGTATREIS